MKTVVRLLLTIALAFVVLTGFRWVSLCQQYRQNFSATRDLVGWEGNT